MLPELLSDIDGGHNIVSTVFLECRAMYRKDGPRHMAAVGEVEFVAGLAAMSASGAYGPCRVAEVIVGGARSTLAFSGPAVFELPATSLTFRASEGAAASAEPAGT